MKIIRTVADLRAAIRDCPSIGVVPTMGAFHEGHLDLMRQARRENEIVIASLFVNPTQFGPSEDFTKYPRDEESDAAMAESVGVDILFCPSVEEMYPLRIVTVSVAEITDEFEGAVRPGHFTGVATVVAKLFNICQPHRAYFGLKDLQQCAVIRAMVSDLCFPLELKFIEIVREESGLARSSRNEYLSPEHRQHAAHIQYTLVNLKQEIERGLDANFAINQAIITLTDLGFKVDYLTLVDANTMRAVSTPTNTTRLIVCARLGGVRLLDNIACVL